jgi:transcriptional regulator NrdR family protein
MTTRFRTESWSWEITPVEVVRETEHRVWFADRQQANKISESYRYHATKEDAIAHLVERAERQRARAKLNLEEAEEVIARLLGSTPLAQPR